MSTLEFPSLSMDAWAQTAPMAFESEFAPANEVAPCPWGFEMMGAEAVLEHADGRRLKGQLVQWDPANNRCLFRLAPDFSEAQWPLTRLRTVTLTRPLPPGSGFGAFGESGGPPGAIAYRITLDDERLLRDIALYHVARPEGHYLARRVSAAGAFERLFVPARAVRRAEFHSRSDAPAQEAPTPGAARPAVAVQTPVQPASGLRFEPVTTPRALLQAVALQASLPVRPIGDILVSLDLISAAELADALALGRGNGALPLGERLVRMGLVTAEGLQRALLMKMNYPLVDLRRFAFDRALLDRVGFERATQYEVLPLARTEDGRIVVALDDPGRLSTLKELRFLLEAALVPALPWSDSVRHVLPVAYGVRDVAGSGVGWFG